MRASSVSLVASLALAATTSFAGCTLASSPSSPSLAYEGCSGAGCSTALSDHAVANGGTATIVAGSSAQVFKVTSSDESIFTAGAGSGGLFSNGFVYVTGHSPGNATLTVYDSATHVYASATVTVANVSRIALDAGVSTSGVKVIPGHFALHATTIGSRGEVLAGDGAIHFGPAGVLHGDTSASSCEGDCVGFSVTGPGAGSVEINAIGATMTLPVESIDPATIDALSFTTGSISAVVGGVGGALYSLSTKGEHVWGDAISCTSDNPSIAKVEDGGLEAISTFASGVSASLTIVGVAVGNTTLRCTVGSATASIAMAISPASSH
ncbi:MAG: hypothetical protein ACHREM_25610 [Polyangiales bacterium]